MVQPRIPFNRPHLVGTEKRFLDEAVAHGHLSGGGPFNRLCAEWLCAHTGMAHAALTPSCTAALEMAAILADIGPGDEVILPSFAFVSTANAFVVRGAVPVFVDVREDTFNIDERLVEAAIGPRTKAIVALHYGGVACDMQALSALAAAHGVMVIEDAAHALMATHEGRPLGGLSDLAAFSFHETKNVHCGEGGALLVRDPELRARAEIVQEKGTNRNRFFRGEVDKYTWVDVGSSYLMSEINAAFLWAQLQEARALTERRRAVWSTYRDALAPLEEAGALRLPAVPADGEHNAHTFPLLLADLAARDRFIAELSDRGVHATFHYVPLHSSPAGKRHGRSVGTLRVSTRVSERLVRLPLWPDLTEDDVGRVVAAVHAALAPAPAPL